ncbi:lipopolysaccharide biosynthesis protein [Eubacteriales bacterium KG127]
MKITSNKNIIFINTVASLVLNIATIIGGFIMPRLIISSLGSEVNGLYLSLEQYLNYFSLAEGGLGGIVVASLYKPLFEGNIEQVSRIIVTVTKFFRKIAMLFLVYLLIVAVVYPLMIKNSFSYNYVFTLTIILGVNFFIRYYSMLIWRMLLNADKKVYVTAFIQTFCLILEVVGFIVCIKIYPNIHIIKTVTVLAYIIQLLMLQKYVQKHYVIDYNEAPDNNLISQRWDGMGIMTAAFIHRNTDIVVLTIASTLSVVSVYSVYSMIVNAIRSIIASVVAGVTPSIGEQIAGENIGQLKKVYDSYEFIMTYIVFLIYSTCAMLIVPFVKIYTYGVTDTNYIQPAFAFIITLSQMVYSLREPTSTIIYAANHYKSTSRYAYAEAIINIGLSLILVYTLGLIGVAIGTLVSIGIRYLFHIHYLEKKIIYKRMNETIKLVGIFSVGFAVHYISGYLYISKIAINYFSWVIYAVITTSIGLIIYTGISFIFYNTELIGFYKIVKNRGK